MIPAVAVKLACSMQNSYSKYKQVRLRKFKNKYFSNRTQTPIIPNFVPLPRRPRRLPRQTALPPTSLCAERRPREKPSRSSSSPGLSPTRKVTYLRRMESLPKAVTLCVTNLRRGRRQVANTAKSARRLGECGHRSARVKHGRQLMRAGEGPGETAPEPAPRERPTAEPDAPEPEQMGRQPRITLLASGDLGKVLW